MTTTKHNNTRNNCGTTSDTMARITLGPNQVAILDYNTREVDIITIDNLDEVDDMETVLDELGYDTSMICYMT